MMNLSLWKESLAHHEGRDVCLHWGRGNLISKWLRKGCTQKVTLGKSLPCYCSMSYLTGRQWRQHIPRNHVFVQLPTAGKAHSSPCLNSHTTFCKTERLLFNIKEFEDGEDDRWAQGLCRVKDRAEDRACGYNAWCSGSASSIKTTKSGEGRLQNTGSYVPFLH